MFCAALLGGCQTQSPAERTPLQQAWGLMGGYHANALEWEEALTPEQCVRIDELLGQASVENPGDANVTHAKAVAAILCERPYATPEALLQEAVRRDPQNTQALVDLGRLQLMHDQYEESLHTLTQAVERDPHAPLAHYHLGVRLYLKGQYLPARDAFQKATILSPAFAEGWRELGQTEQSIKFDIPHYERARKHYLKAIELGAPDVQIHLKWVELQLKNFKAYRYGPELAKPAPTR